MLKQLLCISVSTAIITTSTGGSISALAKESDSGNNTSSIVSTDNKSFETLDSGDYEISITENDKTRTVVMYNKVTQETNTAIYDKATNQLHDEKGNYLGSGYVVATRGVYGPFRAYFDINPVSVGTIVGCILAVGAIVSTAGIAGIGLAALKAGLDSFVYWGGLGALWERLDSGATINGYFEYKQEISGTRARNINRKFAARVGRSGSYLTYSYGNGGWFDTVKPY